MAFGTTAPEASLTTPAMLPVTSCGRAGSAQMLAKRQRRNHLESDIPGLPPKNFYLDYGTPTALSSRKFIIVKRHSIFDTVPHYGPKSARSEPILLKKRVSNTDRSIRSLQVFQPAFVQFHVFDGIAPEGIDNVDCPI